MALSIPDYADIEHIEPIYKVAVVPISDVAVGDQVFAIHPNSRHGINRFTSDDWINDKVPMIVVNDANVKYMGVVHAITGNKVMYRNDVAGGNYTSNYPESGDNHVAIRYVDRYVIHAGGACITVPIASHRKTWRELYPESFREEYS